MYGIRNMQEQCFMTTAVQNTKRLVKAFGEVDWLLWVWFAEMCGCQGAAATEINFTFSRAEKSDIM